MSGRTLTPDQIPRATKEMLNGRTVLQIVSATDDEEWACQRTWEFARAAAAGERRVALIDLALEEPALDAHATKTADEGIVDAFLYGVSLSHVAQAQDVPGLYYVGVGTRTGEPAEVWSSHRWDRLARGFKNEGAILLAYLPAGALNRCTMEADGIIVLAPNGYDPATDVAPGIARKLREGTPLLGVITETASVPKEKVQPAAPPPPPRPSNSWDISGEQKTPPTPPPPRPSSAWDISGPVDSTTEEVEAVEPVTRPSGTVPRSEAVTPVDPMEAVRIDDEDLTPEPDLVAAPATPDASGANPDIDDEFDDPPLAPRTSVRPSRPAPRYEGKPFFEPSPRRPIGNTLFWIGGAVAILVVVAAVYYWSRGAQDNSVETTPIAAVVDSPSAAPEVTAPVDSVPIPEPAPALPVVELTEADSLFYSIQAAALNTLASAMEHGDQFRQNGMNVTVSPVRVLGRVWYRVILGAFSSTAEADSTLRVLWRDGLVENLQGTILRTPQAFDLGNRVSFDSAQVDAQALWDRGIPATALPAGPGGTISMGAFERPGQATIAETMLGSANVQGTLGPRMGIRR